MPPQRGGGGASYRYRGANNRRGTLAPKRSNATRQGQASSSNKATAIRKSNTSNKAVVVSSRKSTGLYTSNGAAVRNVQAYTNAGGKTYNIAGRHIYRAQDYVNEVQKNSMVAAAKRAEKLNPRAKAYVYNIHSIENRVYVGQTTNPSQRIEAHLAGRGAMATKQMTPSHVTFHPKLSTDAAKQEESKSYFQAKERYGMDNVRGAGHTKRFDP